MTELAPWKKKVDLFRRKFTGRQDVFSCSRIWHKQTTDPLTGEVALEEVKSVSPVCQNYGNKNLCLITQKKGGCGDCSNRLFQPVTDEWIWKHISGESSMIVMLLTDRGIKFGAADFDVGDVFEDAKAIQDLSLKYGLPCYIARSSKKGYHVYWFFSDWIPAHNFTSFIRHLFTEAGFYQRAQNNPMMRLPEVFPKQTALVETTRLGNGIKVPMIEPQFQSGFNCWVDGDAQPIAPEKQWEFLESTQDIHPEVLEKTLADHKIEVFKVAASRGYQEARKMEGKESDGGPEKIVPYGSFEDVILGCPALRSCWSKTADGKYAWDISNPNGLFHDARVASMVLAIHTKDGENILKDRWPSHKTQSYIQQAKTAGYAPVTCRWMQERGVCVAGKHPKYGDHCMQKIPPKRVENGIELVNPDKLPPEQWPEPSPIRFATSRHLTPEGVLEAIQTLSEAKRKKLKAGPPEIDPATGHPIVDDTYIPANIEERVEGLKWHTRKFSPEDRKRIDDAISAAKLISKTELKQQNKRIEKEIKKEEFAKKAEGKKSFKGKVGEFYQDDETCSYWRRYEDAKGVPHEEKLTNFIVQIKEEFRVVRICEDPLRHGDILVEDRYFNGVLKTEHGQIVPLERLRVDDWLKSRDTFFRTLFKHAGMGITYEMADFDHVRNCVSRFSMEGSKVKSVCREIGHHSLKNGDAYMMPSVIVTKDQIKPNDEYVIELELGRNTKLDFEFTSPEEAKEISYRIINDLFQCNTPLLVQVMFAHALASAITPQIRAAVDYSKAPTLFIAGTAGNGKTYAAQAVQSLFGHIETGNGSWASAKAKLSLAYQFRHAPLLINDFKQALNDPSGTEIMQMIQGAYDRDERNVLRRDGKQRDAHYVRGLLMVTGEEFPDQEASAISRLVLLDLPMKANREAGARVSQHKRHYCGFTPHFIHFVYQMSPGEIRRMWEDYYRQLHDPVKIEQAGNAAGRICENLTLNMVAFRLAMETMVSLGVDASIRDRLVTEHFQGLLQIRDQTIMEVESSKGSVQFLAILKAMLQDSSRFRVANWPVGPAGTDGPNARTIGFCYDHEPDVVFIIPDIAYPAACDFVARGKEYIQSKQHVVRLLAEENHLDKTKLSSKGGRYTCQRTGPNGMKVRVWPIKLSSLGVEPKNKVIPISAGNSAKTTV